jgi:hypothetical protein
MRGPHAYAKRTHGPPARARYNRPTRDQELTGEVLARAGRRRKSPHLFIDPRRTFEQLTQPVRRVFLRFGRSVVS